MRITADAACPGCQTKTKLRFQKPGFTSRQTQTFRCDVCESQITALISRPTDKTKWAKGFVNIETKVSIASPILLAMIEEARSEAGPKAGNEAGEGLVSSHPNP